jgi:hypothetical protein
MKFLFETALAILVFVGIIYLLFSLGNGSFNFQTCVQEVRNGLAVCSTMVSIVIVFIQIIRYL